MMQQRMRALHRAGTQQIVRLAALVALHAMPATHASAPITVSGHDAATVIARVQVLVNQARARPRRCGREHFPGTQPLAQSSTLQQAAAGHAMQMARFNFFDHAGRDGSQPRDRIARLGYASRLTGENIAYGPESAEEVVAGWLASPGHCANIMDGRFRTMGIAFAIEPRRHAIVWVQDLAWPR